MRKPRWQKVWFNNPKEKTHLKIVGDAGILVQGLLGGRMIPCIILDTRDRPEIDEYIRVQQYVEPGDVKSNWISTPNDEGTVTLFLTFLRPTEMIALIDFEIMRHGILVEQILSTEVFYLQCGKPGDRVKHNVSAPKIFVEVTATGFRPRWDEIFSKVVVKRFRGEGLNRQQAKEAAKNAISELKKFSELRLRSSSMPETTVLQD